MSITLFCGIIITGSGSEPKRRALIHCRLCDKCKQNKTKADDYSFNHTLAKENAVKQIKGEKVFSAEKLYTNIKGINERIEVECYASDPLLVNVELLKR